MARFVYKVVRSWRGFGRCLPSIVCDIMPDTDDEDIGWDPETGDGSDDEEVQMVIDLQLSVPVC